MFACKDTDGHHSVFGTGINTDSQLGFQEFPRNSGIFVKVTIYLYITGFMSL